MKILCYHICAVVVMAFFPVLTSAQDSVKEPSDSIRLTAEDYILEAAYSYSISDFKRAASISEQAVAKYPDLDAAWFYLGLIAHRNGQNERAEEYLSKAAGLDTLNFWYLASLADLFMDSEQADKAISVCQSINSRFPKKTTPQIHIMLGDYQKEHGKDTLALRHYEEALKISPDYTPARFSLAEIYRIQGNYYYFFQHMNVFLADPDINPSFKARYMNEIVLTPQFVSTFKPQVDTMILRLQETHPGDSAAISTAASYYMRSDEQEKGLDLYMKNVELYPDDHAINIEYVSVLYYMERWEELSRSVRNMMVKFPEDETLPEVLAVALWHLGDIQGAIDTYKKQLKITGNPSIRLSCCTAMGDLYQESGDYRKAETYYRKGYSIDPEYLPLLNNYAYFLTKIGKDYQKGLKMSKITILNEPDNPTYLDTYGWLLYLTGDYQDAKAQFKRAMLFGGKENGVILDHYADVLWALKDYEMAFIYYEQAGKLDADLDMAEKIKARRAEIGK